MASCPICSRPAAPRPGNQAFPFCSARCKMVDLGKWLNEDYRVPTDDSQDDASGEGGSGGERGGGVGSGEES